MNCCCENCGWSEIIGSPIICNYSERRTWRDECCEAWKPKEEKDEKDMVNVVRCKDCDFGKHCQNGKHELSVECHNPEKLAIEVHTPDWFCADGERK